MVTSDYDDKKFGAEFLTDIVGWITSHFTPDEVYDEKVLREWALENGFVEES